MVLASGTIPDRDIPALTELGVAGVFTPGAKVDDIAAFFKKTCQPATAGTPWIRAGRG